MTSHNPIDPQTIRYQEAADWLFLLQEDSPSNEQIIQWVEWCSSDPENRKAFEHLMPVWTGFESTHDNRVAAALAAIEANTGARMGRDMVRPNVPDRQIRSAPANVRAIMRRSWRPRRSWVAAAAALVVAVGSLLMRTERVDTLTPIAEFASVVGQIREANLPDGSHIDLGARSEVAIDFLADKRQIDVREGEAFFAVKHDKSRPFVVRAGMLQAVAVGTAFDVLRSDKRVTVTVQDGVVAVTVAASGSAEQPSKPLLVARGSQAIFDTTQSGAPILRVVNPDSANSWRKGLLEYENEPLAAVIATLNRYSPDTIVAQDERIGHMSFTGTIELRSLDEWLQALPSIFPIQVHHYPNHRIALESVPAAAP